MFENHLFENGTEEEKKRATSCRGQLHHDCEIHLSSLFFFFLSFFLQIGNVDIQIREFFFFSRE